MNVGACIYPSFISLHPANKSTRKLPFSPERGMMAGPALRANI
jgi:hypothetical protein